MSKPSISRLFLLLLLVLAGCNNTREQDKLLDATLDQYAATIRWGDVSDAMAFLAPDAPRPTAFDLERLAQLQIAGYREQIPVLLTPTDVEQIVQIEFVNRHTQESRSTIERMRWRYDDTAKRWWLTSGLPKLQASR
jgi:hypothetical protein